MRILTLGALALAMLMLLGPTKSYAQDAKPTITLDLNKLPRMPYLAPRKDQRNQVIMATSAGAVMGILAADFVTGGILLAPLGIPAVSDWFVTAAAATPAPTYSIAQRLLAGVATLAAGVGGGYLGAYAVSDHAPLIAHR